MSLIPKIPQVLCMIPYPSGQLHFGHFRIFSLGSAISKYKQLRESTKIFFPLGFDSFGLPAEVASVKSGKKPLEHTEDNISQIIESLKSIGIEFSDYTDDKCIDNGVIDHERVKLSSNFENPGRLLQTHTETYYKHTQSLFLKLYHAGLITKKLALVNYDPVLRTTLASQETKNGISSRSGARVTSILTPSWYVNITKYASKLYQTPDSYPHSVSSQQKNWIRPIDGHLIDIKIGIKDQHTFIEMKAFITSDPAFIICPITHPLWRRIDPVLKSRLLRKKVNRFSGFNTGLVGMVGNVKFDVYVAPEFELSSGMLSFGSKSDTGHLEFMAKHQIVCPTGVADFSKQEPFRAYRMKDWCISRQRKWGTPIPIVDCPSCGPVPIAESNLPLTRSDQNQRKTSCPKCKSPAVFENDTLDTFFDSSFYFLHLPQVYKPDYTQSAPVDLYIGGPEHSTLHLLYARFITKFLSDQSLVLFSEPFSELLVVGIVQAYSYQNPDGTLSSQPVGREKMSKSKGNGVDPALLVQKYGPGVVRLFMLGRCHPTIDWVYEEKGIEGPVRFVKTLDQFCETIFGDGSKSSSTNDRAAIDKLDEDMGNLIRSVEMLMESVSIHKVVTEMYSFLKKFEKAMNDPTCTPESLHLNLKKFLVVCYPFVDVTVAEIWKKYFANEVMVWPTAGPVKLSKWKVFMDNIPVDIGGDRMDLETVLEQINAKYTHQDYKIVVNEKSRCVVIVK